MLAKLEGRPKIKPIFWDLADLLLVGSASYSSIVYCCCALDQIKDRAGNGDEVKSASISETGVEVQMSGHDLRGELESIVKMDDDQNVGDGGGSFSSSSSAGGTAGTEHADLGSSTPSYDILEYLDSSPPEKPDKIPNALNDASTSPYFPPKLFSEIQL